MITRSGLVCFWIGAVLILSCTTASLWVAETQLGRYPTWQVAVGFGVGSFVLCLILLANRYRGQRQLMAGVWHSISLIDVTVMLALLANWGFVALQLVGEHGRAWHAVPIGLYFVGIALIYMLGDYPPG
ncbi:peptidoglycan recognition protein family protein [Streptomyces sp. 4N124]|uniref:peptidoglycan recognition protein family protein n=1 Tax=Streptomyces sp. 4N124 TaxID=3457420 RepID=UPI003FD03FAA